MHGSFSVELLHRFSMEERERLVEEDVIETLNTERFIRFCLFRYCFLVIVSRLKIHRLNVCLMAKLGLGKIIRPF